MFNIKKLLIGLCTFFAAGSAMAVPTMIIDDGVSSPLTIVDELGLDTASGLPGVVNFAGVLGGWTFTINTGTTKPAPGSDKALNLQVNVTSFGAGTLTVEFSEVDFFTLPDFPYLETSVSHTTSGGTITYETFLDDDNLLFGDDAADNLVTVSDSGGSFSDDALNKPTWVDPFSLTGRITVTHTGAGNTQADLQVEAVPEPQTIAILGLALLGLSLGYRRQRRFA